VKLSRSALVSVLALSLAVVVSTGCDEMKAKLDKVQGGDKAKQRVSGVLDGIRKGGAGTGLDVQRAICLWFNGKVVLDMATLSRASDHFTSWQNEGHIARVISTFEVSDAEGAGATWVVSGTIEGRPFKIRATEGEPLSWVKAPDL
jgi:hypothetical protein